MQKLHKQLGVKLRCVYGYLYGIYDPMIIEGLVTSLCLICSSVSSPLQDMVLCFIALGCVCYEKMPLGRHRALNVSRACGYTRPWA